MCRFAFDDAPARAAHRCVPLTGACRISPLLCCSAIAASHPLSSLALLYIVHFMNSINIFCRFSAYFPPRHTVLTMCQSLSPYPVSALTPPTMPRLADAVRRWLCHPEPSSSSLKSTIKEKLLYDTYLSEFFSLVRKERKGQKEEGVPLLNTFCRLAATGANTLPRPSRNC